MKEILTIFTNYNQDHWDSMKAVLVAKLNECVHNAKIKKGTFQVEIGPFKQKRSHPQLAAYWCLIKVAKKFMNERGNTFTSDEVSDWFKIRAKHCKDVKGVLLPKSIANKSDCSRDDMQKIINNILEFGQHFNVYGCEIKQDDLDVLLNYYPKK